jgi:hypothetical protein
MIRKCYYLLILVLFTSLAALPTPETFITVDRGCGATYYAGESILVTYLVSADPGDELIVTVKEVLPDSTVNVLLSNRPSDPGHMYSMRIFAQPVYGKVTLLLEYVLTAEGESSWLTTECSFYVQEGTFETGNLKIESDQTDFDIYLNDAFVAHSTTTSVLIEGITSGGHMVTLKKAGCNDFSTPVTIIPKRTVTIRATFDCTIADKDGDGVPDESDQCNNPLCNLVDDQGCPLDSDGDGVNDCEDRCPGELGDRESRGCPYGDDDEDGVSNDIDQCSNPDCTIVDETGCPKDSDGDGIIDCQDDCPQESGDRKHFGCPERDSDEDGVIDDEDRCFNPDCSMVDERGCPVDSDGDGILDCEDLCPQEAGSAQTNGCPESDEEEEDAGIGGFITVLMGILIIWRLTKLTS